MDESHDIKVPAAEDATVDSAVLHQILDLHPTQVTVAEIVREIGGQFADFTERDAIERSVRDLAGVGLLHCNNEFVMPTRAALRFNELIDL